MWYILIILAALLAVFLFLYLRTKNTLSKGRRTSQHGATKIRIGSANRKLDGDHEAKSSDNLSLWAAYGRSGTVCTNERIQPYNRAGKRNMISQISGFHSNDM